MASLIRCLVLSLALGLSLALSGCGISTCETPADCPTGFVCTDSGSCQVISCNSSLDCPIESWCAAETGQCQAGCLNDRDCLPTQACDQDSLSCYVPGCRSTALDCDIGEFCNTVSGQCVQAGGFYCSECETSFDCGSENNWCIRMGTSQTYCGVDCSAGQECPRGYFCSRVRGAGNVTVAYQCVAPCWEL
jgi:hypothetical protein